MTDLVTFLKEHLDEDEDAAKRVRQPYRLYACEDGHLSEPVRVDDLYGDRDGEYDQWEDGEDRLPNHHNSWALVYDPARVLREIQAKRQILDDYERALKNSRAHPGDAASAGALLALHGVVKTIAATYADHPAFREEWRV
jgi:hypothetical protein